ncbi:uncharacterized protein LOC134206253 [Armigeres subalbatus]|uniref:uncharacterized protein LOC134206253 n=1 Tax=Armigeres subalbatus TaxID=124917 RepID=UPI002ED24E00
MPRKYVPRLCARNYANYTQEALASALKSVKQNGMSIRQASKHYKISFGTLYNRCKNLHTKSVGTPTVLSSAQEKELSEVIKVAGEWGYPLPPGRVAILVKKFLDDNLMKTRFVDNRPGPDWIASFMKRTNLAARCTQNIKRARAKVCPRTVKEYFDNLARTLHGIPKENIINYDETNFTDDPGSRRVICRRGQKHVERVLDHSKSSYSVMFAGTADGKTLSTYVVYAALHLYPTWVQGGPKGSRYNRTKSGWFDERTYEDWILTVSLPYCKKIPNDKPRVLIGDNVASHMSIRAIKSCMENNIGCGVFWAAEKGMEEYVGTMEE